MTPSETLHIIHLLSWFPTEENPSFGNFCLRHIEAVSSSCHSVVVTTHLKNDMTQKRDIQIKKEKNYTHVSVYVKSIRTFPFFKKQINKLRLYKAYDFAYKYIKKHIFKPDLIHLHVALPLGRIALYWKYKYGIPYVLTEHWTIYLEQNKQFGPKKIPHRILRIANHASLILPVNENLKINMQQCGIKTPFTVVPNVTDTDLFTIKDKNPSQKKQMLHVSTLYDRQKNISGLLRTIHRLYEKRQDFVLNIIHNYKRPAFEKYVIENHLNDCVIFHGRKTEKEIVNYYQQADFFVLFSNFENLPCVILESFACGLPVISTKVGEVPYIINSERGRLIDVGDEEALYNEINFMLDHYTEFSKQDIRTYALEHYAKEKIEYQILNAYHRCLQNI